MFNSRPCHVSFHVGSEKNVYRVALKMKCISRQNRSSFVSYLWIMHEIKRSGWRFHDQNRSVRGSFVAWEFYPNSETHFLVRKTTKMATDSGTSYYQVNQGFGLKSASEWIIYLTPWKFNLTSRHRYYSGNDVRTRELHLVPPPKTHPSKFLTRWCPSEHTMISFICVLQFLWDWD